MSVNIGAIVRDRNWVKRSFLVTNTDLDLDDNKYRYFSTAAMKFTDTTPGGNYEINPLPQFTKYCDLSPPNKSRSTASDGMGRFYSEVFDDNSQRINMRFGVPQYNSLSTFFTGFYNVNAGRLARTGRSPSIAFTLGKLAGMVVPFFFPHLLMVGLIGAGARFFLDKPSSKYYFMKPTMPLYWHAVQTMVNNLAVNTGMVPRLMGEDANKKFNDNYQFGPSEQELMAQMLPDIFQKGGTINVYNLANKAQRLARMQEKQMAAAAASDSPIQAMLNVLSPTNVLNASPGDWDAYMAKWVGGSSLGAGGGGGSSTDVGDLHADVDAQEKLDKTAMKNDPGFLDFYNAEADDGSAFVTFRVNYTGPVNESFSNQVGTSEIQNKINGMAAQGRATSFNFANGNVTEGLGSIVGGLKDLVAGVADGLGVAGLGVLAGGAFVDIPKYWQDSQAQLAKSTYTINLCTPYNNPISRMINIYIPLCMLLAGALPLSTGRQSYTSPFLCEIYDRGRCQTRLGMIESLTVTRGTGNTGFNSDGMAMGFEVTFSVVDMSSVLHMPIAASFNHEFTDALGTFGAAVGGVGGAVVGSAAGVPGAVVAGTAGAAAGETLGSAGGALLDTASSAISSIGSLFDDETVFSDYMAVLSSMGMRDQVYGFPKLKLRLTRLATQWDTWLSAGHFASVMGDQIPGRLLSAIYRGSIKN